MLKGYFQGENLSIYQYNEATSRMTHRDSGIQQNKPEYKANQYDRRSYRRDIQP
jgi:hypothetical protein